jgi:hypothetical protein
MYACTINKIIITIITRAVEGLPFLGEPSKILAQRPNVLR